MHSPIIESDTFYSQWQLPDNNSYVFNKYFSPDTAIQIDSSICTYKIIAKDEKANISRFSKGKSSVLDLSMPVIEHFSAEPQINESDSTSDGSIIIEIGRVSDRISGVKYCELYRKTAEDKELQYS